MITYDFYANLQKLADDLGYSFEKATAPYPGQIKKNEHNVLEYRLRPKGNLRFLWKNVNCNVSPRPTTPPMFREKDLVICCKGGQLRFQALC